MTGDVSVPSSAWQAVPIALHPYHPHGPLPSLLADEFRGLLPCGSAKLMTSNHFEL